MQFSDLLFQFGAAGGVVGGGPGAIATVDFCLSNPGPECLAVDAELLGDPGDRSSAGVGVLACVECHAGGSLA
ncbi:hypothetical protein A606_03290 [Corynebacterium terpenotabidum Y-11]|uniref:Uncharacterized protein n=1 Tax=Corynebacterium terpenotabidum Y-11 TaxID=1200352 RepID=S4XCJ2_9CORY|nr:hypothetical protein A606_03290 [Corynebacterium terpenotabidum Y-11]